RAAGALPAAGTTLDVRPVAPAEALARAQRAGRPSRAQALTPAERATLEARLARVRAFRPQERELQSRAARVGAGIPASRRPGWRPTVRDDGIRQHKHDRSRSRRAGSSRRSDLPNGRMTARPTSTLCHHDSDHVVDPHTAARAVGVGRFGYEAVNEDRAHRALNGV